LVAAAAARLVLLHPVSDCKPLLHEQRQHCVWSHHDPPPKRCEDDAAALLLLLRGPMVRQRSVAVLPEMSEAATASLACPPWPWLHF
jgi:hypothetical protein